MVILGNLGWLSSDTVPLIASESLDFACPAIIEVQPSTVSAEEEHVSSAAIEGSMTQSSSLESLCMLKSSAIGMPVRKFSVGESCIRNWHTNKSKLQQTPGKTLHLAGGGCKHCGTDMEKALPDWLYNQRFCHLCVNRSDIQRKAVQLYQGDAEFL